MGEVGGDVEARGPHQTLASNQHRPEEEADRQLGSDSAEHISQAPEDHSRGLAVAGGRPGPCLACERGLEEADVSPVLPDPPVRSLSLQDPLGILKDDILFYKIP